MESSPQIRAKGADSGLLPLAHATSTCQFPPPGGRTPVPDWISVVPTSSPIWCSATGEKMVATRWATKVPTQKASKWCHLWHVPDLGNDPTWWERSIDTNKARPWTTATRQWQSIPRDLEPSTAAERYEIAVFDQATFAKSRKLMHI